MRMIEVIFTVKTKRTNELLRFDRIIFDDPIKARKCYDELMSGGLSRLKNNYECSLIISYPDEAIS